MKKSEKNPNGNRRSSSKNNSTAPAPDVRMRRQEPSPEHRLARHTLTLDLSGEAWTHLQRMAAIEDADVEYAARRAIGQAVATQIEGGSCGDPSEPIVAMFIDSGTPAPATDDELQKQDHVVSITLNDYGMAALRFYAVDAGLGTPEEAALECVREMTCTMTQITEGDFNERFSK